MRKSDAMDAYLVGAIPTIEDIQGIWKVKMWGWWRFMKWDKKVISGKRGYNLFLGIRWGGFNVEQLEYTIRLTYDKGGIEDYLKLYDTVFVGRFMRNGRYKATFMLEKS